MKRYIVANDTKDKIVTISMDVKFVIEPKNRIFLFVKTESVLFTDLKTQYS